MRSLEAIPELQQLEEEKQEVERVLKLVLHRSPHLSVLFRYICDQYFAGKSADVKEYSIAVEAFGKPSSFDPSRDSIVRVEALRLRQKLSAYYSHPGATSPMQISIPAGGYVPRFTYLPAVRDEAQDSSSDILASEPIPSPTEPAEAKFVVPVPVTRRARFGRPAAAGFILMLGVIVLLIGLRLRNRHSGELPEARSSHAKLLSAAGRPPIRILAGYEGVGFTDASGITWLSDRFFQSGEAESISPKPIILARDPAIYQRRRRGTFDYNIPVAPGNYELRLHFADAFFGEDNIDGGGELSRLFDVRCNGVTLLDHFDLIEDAGGSNTADVKVFEGIHGDKDGRVHLQFISRRDVAFINAIELLPTDSPSTLPIRIVPSLRSVRDRDGQEWSSDEYYRGGVILANDRSHSIAPDPWDVGQRIGNFQYSIPVAVGRTYDATVVFRDLGIGRADRGPGADVFNVSVNGQQVLAEISLNEGQSITKILTHLRPNAQGKLIFWFQPVKSYAVLNALQIVESSPTEMAPHADAFQR
jgi:Malectin domain